jgi:hypothetical protein
MNFVLSNEPVAKWKWAIAAQRRGPMNIETDWPLIVWAVCTIAGVIVVTLRRRQDRARSASDECCEAAE